MTWKTPIAAFILLSLNTVAAYADPPRSTTATMYKDLGLKKDGYGTTYHYFNIRYGSVSEHGQFKVDSTTKNFEAKPGSSDETFMKAASGYEAWCVVSSDDMAAIGQQPRKDIKRDGHWYATFNVTSVKGR